MGIASGYTSDTRIKRQIGNIKQKTPLIQPQRGFCYISSLYPKMFLVDPTGLSTKGGSAYFIVITLRRTKMINIQMDPSGFEPLTFALQMRRSNQLNYGPLF